MVNIREARVELITAVLCIVVFILFLLNRINDPTAMLLGGGLLLGSGIYQSMRGWPVAVTTWIAGLILFFGGLGMRLFLVAYMEINYVLIGLAILGIYLFWMVFMRRSQ